LPYIPEVAFHPLFLLFAPLICAFDALFFILYFSKIITMETTLHIFLIIHIIAGFLSLITGFISMLNRKGGKQHRLTGKLFFWGMTGVFITSVVIALLKGLAFLLMVGFFSYYLAASGYRSLYLKKLHLDQKAGWPDWLISSIGILSGAALVIFSVGWFIHRGAWGFVPLAFGTLILVTGISDMIVFVRKTNDKQRWIVTHGGRMGGSFAATVTAFIVVNLNIGEMTWILWILPGVLVSIWISVAIRNYLKPVKRQISRDPALAAGPSDQLM
jgi:hypothetical protein